MGDSQNILSLLLLFDRLNVRQHLVSDILETLFLQLHKLLLYFRVQVGISSHYSTIDWIFDLDFGILHLFGVEVSVFCDVHSLRAFVEIVAEEVNKALNLTG